MAAWTHRVTTNTHDNTTNARSALRVKRARACSILKLRTGIAFCPSWMRKSYASRRALDEPGAADRDMPPQGQDPAPGSAAHDFGPCLAASERGQVARHPG